MYRPRTDSITSLFLALVLYVGACGYFLKQEPVVTLPAYKSCEESCTASMQFYLPKAAQRTSLTRELGHLFQSYSDEEAGYFVDWSGDICELHLYASSPNALAVLTTKLEAQMAPFSETKTQYIIDRFDGITQTLFSRI